MGKGPSQVTNPNQTLNAEPVEHGSQTASDKVRSREGKSPDRQLRSPNPSKWKRMWKRRDNQEVGLEAANL